MRSEPYPGTLIAHTSAVDVSSSSVELSPSVRADLMNALRRAEEVPLPDTTPPEERQRREADRLRAQLESTLAEANAVLRDQHDTHMRNASDYHRAMKDNTQAELATQRAVLTSDFNSHITSESQRANAERCSLSDSRTTYHRSQRCSITAVRYFESKRNQDPPRKRIVSQDSVHDCDRST